MRIPQNLQKQRAAACTPAALNGFYDLLEKKITELGLEDKPHSIFNCDEAGFTGSYGRRKVIARKGDKNPHSLTCDNDKLSYTVHVSYFSFII